MVSAKLTAGSGVEMNLESCPELRPRVLGLHYPFLFSSNALGNGCRLPEAGSFCKGVSQRKRDSLLSVSLQPSSLQQTVRMGAPVLKGTSG